MQLDNVEVSNTRSLECCPLLPRITTIELVQSSLGEIIKTKYYRYSRNKTTLKTLIKLLLKRL